jgi:hypothetical protein
MLPVKLEMRLAVLIREDGEAVAVEDEYGQAWWVPRLYVAVHGVTNDRLYRLARRYGWQPA